LAGNAKKTIYYFIGALLTQRSIVGIFLLAVAIFPFTFLIAAVGFAYSGIGKINEFWRGRALLVIDFLKKFHGSLYTIALQAEFDAMAKCANKNKNIDCWFILNPFATTSGKLLEAPVVALVADFVPIACPSGFSPLAVEVYRKRLSELDPVVAKYITISKHVAQLQLENHLGIGRDRINTIHHGAVSIKKDLSFEFSWLKSHETKFLAANDLRKYIANRNYCGFHLSVEWLDLLWNKYLEDFPFENVRFVMVSTQNRSYKNTFSVIKAVELLIKQRGFGVKLIMTGALDDEMQQYIKRNALYFDVISIPRVPDNILAALYHCATVAVHASFFEGGIGAFPFYEAISVGTPVILSRNPASMELTPDDKYQEFLFDPYSVDELADRIRYVCENPHATYQWQLELYKKISQRSWAHASAEYFEVFQSAIDLNKL
jgi:glycosyltransferase involved in cell wall biosynthesis